MLYRLVNKKYLLNFCERLYPILKESIVCRMSGKYIVSVYKSRHVFAHVTAIFTVSQPLGIKLSNLKSNGERRGRW